MLKPFSRSSSSDKHSKTLNIDQFNSFNMTIADMDVGVFPPLHNRIIQQFSAYFYQQKNAQSQLCTFVSTQKYKEARQKAAKSIISWYNNEYKCSFSYFDHLSGLRQETQNNSIAKNINNQVNVSVSIHFAPSAVSLCSYSILSCTSQGDKVLIFTPVYSTYIAMIGSLKRQVIALQLSQQVLYNKKYGDMLSQFSIDFKLFENELSKGVKAVLLSHPHNPGGKVWSKNQLQNMVRLCKKYNTCIISDQILSDLYLGQNLHQFHTLGKEIKNFSQIIIVNSVSKSFNYSSIQGGYAIVSDPKLILNLKNIIEEKYADRIDLLAFSSVVCCLGSSGKIWLQLIKKIIGNNFRKLVKFQQEKAKQLKIGNLQSAYLVIADFSFYFQTLLDLVKACQKYNFEFTKLEQYYSKAKVGIRKVRICIACQQQHFDRFLVYLQKIINESFSSKIEVKIKPKL